jgi:phage-related protein (TIGR01555 family)
MNLTQTIKSIIHNATRTAGDGYVNLDANIGQTGVNIASGGGYVNNYATRQPQMLRTMYRTSFIVRRACDARADDMVKAGCTINSEIDPKAIDNCYAELSHLRFWQQLGDALRWSFLFGTAFIMPVIDGHDLEKPLKIDSIGKGQLKGFQVLDRWQLLPSWGDGRILTLGRDNGYPIYYNTIANGVGLGAFKIHHSRLFRIDATPLPWWDKYTENFYSASIVESILDRVKAFDQASASAVALIEAQRNDVIYTDTLPQAAGENAGLYGRLSEKYKQMMRFRSNNGLTILGVDEKIERLSSALTGVSEIIDRMAEQVAGATEIPLVRLLGKSSGGLNGGDGDVLTMYYEDINRRQEAQISHIVRDIIIMAILSGGNTVKDGDVTITFNALKEASQQDKSLIAAQSTDMIIKAFESSLITQQVALKELAQLTEFTGYYSNITDVEIAQADDKPPVMELTSE